MSKRRFRSRRRWEDEYANLFDDYVEVEVKDDDEQDWDEDDDEIEIVVPRDTYFN